MSIESDVNVSDCSNNEKNEKDDSDTAQTITSREKRHYHTLRHLEEMFGYSDLFIPYELNHVPDNGVTPTEKGMTLSVNTKLFDAILTLSIFFHDAIYNPKSSTNEEDSVALYKNFEADFITCIYAHTGAKPNSKLELCSRHVEDFILATKSHTPTTKINTTTTAEDSSDRQEQFLQSSYQPIFLDANMAVLGKQNSSVSALCSTYSERISVCASTCILFQAS